MKIFSGIFLLLFFVTGVRAASSIVGDMQEWNPADSDYNLIENDNNVWILTKTLSAGDYEYKVVEGDSWDESSYPQVNQVLNLSIETSITWKVNLDYDLVFDSEHPPIVCGDFMSEIGETNWGETSILTRMIDDGISPDLIADDDIYTYQVSLPEGNYEFKIVLNNNWDQSTSDNISFYSDGTNPTTVTYNMSNNKIIAERTSKPVTVTFKVDMSNLEDPLWYSHAVSVGGSEIPLNWEFDSNLLSYDNEDLIYTADILFPAGSNKNIEFKYARCDNDEICVWEYDGNNRIFTLDESSSTQTLDIEYFGCPNPDEYTIRPVTVTFKVDVSDAVSAEVVFDSLGIYGQESPLDWCWLDGISCEGMTTINNPMEELVQNQIWTIDIPFPTGTWKNIEFKFGRNGEDLEAGPEENHSFTIDDANPAQIINCVYGDMGALSIDDWNFVPNSIVILQNYPNPFNPTTNISFSLPSKNPKNAKIVIYNLTGQMVKQYSIFENQSSIVCNAENQASGVYFYKLLIDNEIIATQKMILLK